MLESTSIIGRTTAAVEPNGKHRSQLTNPLETGPMVCFSVPLHPRSSPTRKDKDWPFGWISQIATDSQVSAADVRCSSISTAWIRVRRRRQEPNMSTFAIWVGNIPRDAGIMDLVDHFAQDATEDIQSVFLIIKSQCAFVNYRTEKACRTAFSRFDGSILKRKLLLCRLRMGVRPSAARSTAPVSDCAEGLEHGGEDSRLPKTEGSTQTRYSPPRTTDRYFIMKSHTVADLEMSSKTGVWATQIHNEGSLNQAFKVSYFRLVGDLTERTDRNHLMSSLYSQQTNQGNSTGMRA